MLITTKLSLDFQKPSHPVTVNAVQGDRNTRCIQVSLLSEGAPWQIPEDVRVAMRFRKPDMTGGYYDTMPDGTAAWSVDENVVTMFLAPQMLTVSGTVLAQLELLRENSTLGCFTMYVNVEPDPSAGIITSEDYINWLEWLEDQVTERLHDAIDNGDFQGPVGEPGEAAQLLRSEVTYRLGTSGTQPPEGQWVAQIPQAQQSCYLRSRTVYIFNTGDPVTQYAVSYLNLDSPGVRKRQAVLLASAWSDEAPFIQEITLEMLAENENVRVYPQTPTGTLEEKLALAGELAKVRWSSLSGSTVTFECPEEKPALDLPVIVEVYV